MKTFIIHYLKLVNRKQHILTQLANQNISNYEFIEIDRDSLPQENLQIFEQGYNKAQIAICLSHFYAYKSIAEKCDFGLILEDDVILSPMFSHNLQVYIQNLPNDFDMLFIGNGCNLHIPWWKKKRGKFIYKKFHKSTCWGGQGATRCADSYIVSNAFAKRFLHEINNYNSKINLPIDLFLNILLKQMNANIYWAEPTIVTQGSQNGMFMQSY